MPRKRKPKFDLYMLDINISDWDMYYSFSQREVGEKDLCLGDDPRKIHQKSFIITLNGVFNFISPEEKKIKKGDKAEVTIRGEDEYYFEYDKKRYLETNDERVAYVGSIVKNYSDYFVILRLPENDLSKLITLVASNRVEQIEVTYTITESGGYIIKNFGIKTYKDEE